MHSPAAPSVIALAGPNGAGKSTAGPSLLHETLGTNQFVNADVIARGLSAFEPERVARAAGRIMLTRLKELAAARETFAFETTLSGRTYAPWIRNLLGSGYRFQLVFLWLPSAEMAVERVRSRVRRGGHDIPVATIRRRYEAGLRNFFELYGPMATWRFYDNSGSRPRIIARGSHESLDLVADQEVWFQLVAHYGRNAHGG